MDRARLDCPLRHLAALAFGCLQVALLHSPARSDGNEFIWLSDEPVATLKGPIIAQGGPLVREIEFSPDGSRLLVIYGWNILPNPTIEMRLYDMATASLIEQLPLVTSACFVADTNVIAACEPSYMRVTMIDASSGDRLRSISTADPDHSFRGEAEAIAGHPTEPVVALGLGGETIRLLNVTTGATLSERSHTQGEDILMNAPRSLRFDELGNNLWAEFASEKTWNIYHIESDWRMIWSRVRFPQSNRSIMGQLTFDARRNCIYDIGGYFLRESFVASLTPPSIRASESLYRVDLEAIRSGTEPPFTGLAYDPLEQYVFAYRSRESAEQALLLIWDRMQQVSTAPAFTKTRLPRGLGSIAISPDVGWLAVPSYEHKTSRTGVALYQYSRKDRKLEAVVLLTSPSGEQGGGTVISSEGHLLTAAHLLEGAMRLSGQRLDRTPVTAELIKVLSSDVALLKLSNERDGVALRTNCAVPARGSEVVALGHPHGGAAAEWQYSRGIIANINDAADRALTDMDGDYGMSGGPLLDEADRVVGIITSMSPKDKKVRATLLSSICGSLRSLKVQAAGVAQ